MYFLYQFPYPFQILQFFSLTECTFTAEEWTLGISKEAAPARNPLTLRKVFGIDFGSGGEKDLTGI
jgi:hypothetical protein